MDDALANTSDDAVRAILTALCADRAIRLKVNEYLKRIDSKIDSKSSKLSSTSGTKSRKRKAVEEIKICVQCQQPFYESENSEKACKFHDGNLDVDYDGDFWADHDEDCHGTIDTEEMREEYPDGFTWDCCDEAGSAAGCTQGRHKATGATKGHYGDGSQSN